MTVTVERQHLLHALSLVLPASARSPYRPAALRGVHLQHHDGELTVTAQDDIAVSCTVPAYGDGLDALAPGKALRDLTRRAAGAITLDAGEGHLVARWARTSAELAALPADDWPQPLRVDGDAVKLTAADVGVLRRVATHASTDDGRPALTGICIDGDMAIATDSYRLAVGGLTVDVGARVIIPAAVTRFLPRRMLDTESIVVTITETAVRVDTGDVTVTAPLIAGEYPDVQGLLDRASQDATGWVTFGRETLAGAVRAAAVIADRPRCRASRPRTPIGVRLDITGHRTAEVGATGEPGRVTTEVAVLARDGKLPDRVHYNPRYLLDLLAVPDTSDVTLHLQDDIHPVLVRDHLFSLLLMPLRSE